MKIHDLPGTHPLSLVIVFIALLIFGAISFFFLTLEELPELPLPAVTIVAEFGGFPPGEVEQLITIPMENALTSVKGVKKMTSISRQGLSAVTLYFDWDSDPELTALEVREIIDGIYPFLPEGIKKPIVFTESLSEKPLMVLVCLPVHNTSIKDHYRSIKYDLNNRLRRIDGVARIKTAGLRRPEILIEADMDTIYGMNLSIGSISGYLGQFLVDRPAGKITEGDKEQLIQLSSGIRTPQEIAALPVQAGSTVTIGEIGQVGYDEEDATSLFLYQGMSAVGLEIYKTPSGSDLTVARTIRNSLVELNREFEGEFNILLLEDRSEGIQESLRSLVISLSLGLVASMVVLFWLYDNRKIAIVTSVSIPLTMILVFFLLYIFDITINTISLLGMIIGIGLIADNSIIILEEIQEIKEPSQYGKAIAQISPAIFSSSLTTLLVFLPPLFIPGISSVLFRDLILTILFLVSISLAVSHFFTPALYALLMKSQSIRDKKSLAITKLERYYKSLILRFLPEKQRNPMALFLSFILLLCVLVVSIVGIRSEILPKSPESHWILSSELPGDWSMESIQRESSIICQRLVELDQNVLVSVESGYEKESLKERAQAGQFKNLLKFHLYLPQETAVIDKEILAVFQKTQLENISYNPVRTTLEDALFPESGENATVRQPVLRFKPDRESLISAGLTASSLQAELQGAVEGIPAGEVSYNQEKIIVKIKADEKYLDSPGKLLFLKIPSSKGFIELGELISLKKTWEAGERLRIDRQDMEDKILVSQTLEVGPFLRLYLFALILMFLVLGIQTESFVKTTILFASLPLSLLGSLIFLQICGYSLNLYSFIGILIMQGTVINTAILLLDRVNGHSVGELLYLSGRRLRPVFSTILTTVCALVPILIQSLLKGSAEGGMAASVIGGMLGGTPLILLYIPVFFGRSTYFKRAY